jgi:hypothetical protein
MADQFAGYKQQQALGWNQADADQYGDMANNMTSWQFHLQVTVGDHVHKRPGVVCS